MSDTLDDVESFLSALAAGGSIAGWIVTAFILFILVGVVAVFLNIVEDTLGVNIGLAGFADDAFSLIGDLFSSMIHAIGDVLQ